jgi:hypothetical protein
MSPIATRPVFLDLGDFAALGNVPVGGPDLPDGVVGVVPFRDTLRLVMAATVILLLGR